MTRPKRAMKNHLSFPLLLLTVLLGLSEVVHAQEDGGEFKAAGVDIQRVFQEFYKTRKTENDITEERILIEKADRKLRSQLKMADKEIKEGVEKAEGVEMTEEERANFNKKIARMAEERNRLSLERKARYKQNNNNLNRDMMITMKGLLGQIQRFVQAHAEKSGYDIVFDTSGTSTNQTPPVLGGKGILGITATVIAELNRENPALKDKE